MKTKLALLLIAFSITTTKAQESYFGKRNQVGIEPLSHFFTKRIFLNASRTFGRSTIELSFGLQVPSTTEFTISPGVEKIPDVYFFNNKEILGKYTSSSYSLAFGRRKYLNSDEFSFAPQGAFYGFILEYTNFNRKFSFESLNVTHEISGSSTTLFYTNGYSFIFGKSFLIEPNIMFGIGTTSIRDSQASSSPLGAINPLELENGTNPMRVYTSQFQNDKDPGILFFFELQPRLRFCYLF